MGKTGKAFFEEVCVRKKGKRDGRIEEKKNGIKQNKRTSKKRTENIKMNKMKQP